MAALQVVPRKLVVEWRYKPELGFYGKMDAVGIDHADHFPDWQRTPLTLELRNRKRHRRVFLSVRRSFFDCDGLENQASEFEFAGGILDRVGGKLELGTYERIGVRQWFATDLHKTFTALMDDVYQKFYQHNQALIAVVGTRVKDVAYVIDVEHADGWRYNLKLGPMRKQQWFDFVQYELGNFEDEDDGETFAKFRASIPEQFLFIDMDCYQTDLPAAKSLAFVRAVQPRSQEIVQGLIKYCQG